MLEALPVPLLNLTIDTTFVAAHCAVGMWHKLDNDLIFGANDFCADVMGTNLGAWAIFMSEIGTPIFHDAERVVYIVQWRELGVVLEYSSRRVCF